MHQKRVMWSVVFHLSLSTFHLCASQPLFFDPKLGQSKNIKSIFCVFWKLTSQASCYLPASGMEWHHYLHKWRATLVTMFSWRDSGSLPDPPGAPPVVSAPPPSYQHASNETLTLTTWKNSEYKKIRITDHHSPNPPPSYLSTPHFLPLS